MQQSDLVVISRTVEASSYLNPLISEASAVLAMSLAGETENYMCLFYHAATGGDPSLRKCRPADTVPCQAHADNVTDAVAELRLPRIEGESITEIHNAEASISVARKRKQKRDHHRPPRIHLCR